jgi:murein DD-endopeptidase MepM/ murein hydrolase activator NlpD
VDPSSPLRFTELVGLSPWRERWRQTLIVLRGEDDVPPSRFGVSSLRMLRPRIGIPLWRGRPYIPNKVLLTNLFNHKQTPIEAGWSVLRTQVEDFRGRDMTYDSHNGTDLSIPVGSTLLTAAAGRVVEVVCEFNRGGLKIFIDHGAGLMTCYAHLARALVQVGDVVQRGQVIARTGYSGLDGLVTFPFGVPHVHFNTWLNGEPVDPFPRGDEGALWRHGAPTSLDGPEQEAFEPSMYSAEAVDAVIDGCKTPAVQAELRAIESLELRAARTIIAMNYYPTRFAERRSVYAETSPRSQRLDLPFARQDFDGVVFVDEV